MPDAASAAWEEHARDWINWAQPANRDGFWTTTWPNLAPLLPPPGGPVLDLGCGEGRGMRELQRLGYDVIGLDRSATLAAAAAADSSPVVLADAARIPLRDESVAVVFASMSLLDITDLESAVAESSRVLKPGGCLVAAIVHPFESALDQSALRAGRLELGGRYDQPRLYTDAVERNGFAMTFTSIHRPLEHYLGALRNNGFVVTDLHEAGDGEIPWLLAFRAHKQVASATDLASAGS